MNVHLVQELVALLLDDPRTGVESLVNAVPEAHELGGAVFVLDLIEEFFNAADLLNVTEHGNDFLIGAAVERTGKSGNTRRNGGVQVHLCAADGPDRGGGAVLFVVGVKDQQAVDMTCTRGLI